MDKPEKGAIKHEQARETGNTYHTRRRNTKQKYKMFL